MTRLRTLTLTAVHAVLLAACADGGGSPGLGTATPVAPSTSAATSTTTTTTTSTTATTTTTTAVALPRAAAPTGMVDVRDVEPSIVVALNKVGADNVTGAPLPGYEANRAFLLPAGAQALARVQRSLAPRGLGLKVYDGYRPYRATVALVNWARSIGRGDLVGPYLASVSYHNSGQAVDLTVIERATGRDLDMGAPYETFTPAVFTANATGPAADNRRLLVDAMEAEGFDNYEGEWWHFYYYVTGAPVLDEPIR